MPGNPPPTVPIKRDEMYTGDALEAADDEMRARGRHGTARHIVLITDGVPCTSQSALLCSWMHPPTPDLAQLQKAKAAAKRLKESGVTITVIQ
eukprot:gene1494-1692_t